MIGRTARLAARDYRHEWQISGCFVLALAAVLGPMMVLFGLKFGIVGGMLQNLIDDPRNREIVPIASGRYQPGWIENLAGREDIAFIVPRTRSIAAIVELSSSASTRIVTAEVLPSGPGDPVLVPDAPPPDSYDRVVLSRAAAEKLGVGEGDRISASLAREFQGRKERVHLSLKVAALAPAGAFARDGVFVALPLIEALEDYRDGRAVPALQWEGARAQTPEERNYPGFRLYTRSIYDVANLSAEFQKLGIEVRNRAEDIALVQRMDRNLTGVYWAIAIIGLVGFSLSLGASLWANVDRKRRELSILRLVGFRTGDIIWFPVFQSLLTGFLGWALACAIYFGAAGAINTVLSTQLDAGQKVARLLPEHFGIALALTLGAAIISAALAGLRAARIEPADGLREV